MIRIGCFHAHYSNIEHIEQALSPYQIELIHYVDPGLDRMKKDADFTPDTVQHKVSETLNWIVKSHVDAILVTCTFFTATIPDNHSYSIPIIKIDQPLFHDTCRLEQPVIFAFTNPNTIEGTMAQFRQFAANQGVEIEAQSVLIPHSFELIMKGKKSEYLENVERGLSTFALENPSTRIIAAQLSMVPAAKLATQSTNLPISNHLESLASYMVETLNLQPK
ncbi:hypothetical protein NV379_20345 [Paenibacillus sp. N1-5-1-14]|uniref:hypothetical protein n=1 Tax=Paenibacillus radicibacter TaxID=2972488 RepID=UPI00215921B6|nr:hypothetical protein [Paenibacillus radicibacter]MCR8645008.1 hypothetical protein [Paenibacillus radicibacter]